jgi:hypothetical protein
MPSIEVEYIPTNSILRHPRNPKKHPEDQIHRLEASIQKFGWTSPIILSSDGYILAGHARYEAASGEKLMRFTMTEEQAQLVENCLSLVSASSRGEKLFRICEEWSDRL